jgi:hypothetical protein
VKTISLKKVSVLAVASLGFGLMSVVPAQAGAGTCTAWTEFAGSKVSALNLVGATANTNTTNSAVVVNMGATLANTTATANDEATCAAVKFVGYLESYPAGAFAAITTAAAGTPLAYTGANASNFVAPAVTVRQTTSGTQITGSANPATAAAGIGALHLHQLKLVHMFLKYSMTQELVLALPHLTTLLMPLNSFKASQSLLLLKAHIAIRFQQHSLLLV